MKMISRTVIAGCMLTAIAAAICTASARADSLEASDVQALAKDGGKAEFEPAAKDGGKIEFEPAAKEAGKIEFEPAATL
jgi:hypothetical protein